MFDVFLQKETDLEHPACGGIFSKKSQPLNREDLLFHFSENEIKDSTPIPQEIISAFTLLVNDEEGFFTSIKFALGFGANNSYENNKYYNDNDNDYKEKNIQIIEDNNN